MKAQVIGLILVLVPTLSAHAVEQKNSATVLQADISAVYLQEGGLLQKQEITSGTVRIDRKEKEITLTLFGGPHCPPGAMCLVGPMIYEYSAKLVSVKRNECNEKVFR